jgi:hypothetical protein
MNHLDGQNNTLEGRQSTPRAGLETLVKAGCRRGQSVLWRGLDAKDDGQADRVTRAVADYMAARRGRRRRHP